MRLSFLLLAALQFLPEAPYASRLEQPLQTTPDPRPRSAGMRVLGLPALSDVVFPPGSREIRIGDNWNYGPVPFFRLVELEGREPIGQLFWISPGGETSANRTCGTPEPYDYSLCVIPAEFESPPDWREIAEQLERIGVWSISEPCYEPGGITITLPGGRTATMVDIPASHTPLLDMTRLEGEAFSSFRCYENSRRTRTSDGVRAEAIYRWFQGLVRSARPSPDVFDFGG